MGCTAAWISWPERQWRWQVAGRPCLVRPLREWRRTALMWVSIFNPTANTIFFEPSILRHNFLIDSHCIVDLFSNLSYLLESEKHYTWKNLWETLQSLISINMLLLKCIYLIYFLTVYTKFVCFSYLHLTHSTDLPNDHDLRTTTKVTSLNISS